MKRINIFVGNGFENLKGILFTIVRTKAIRHAFNLGGITSLEVLFQTVMREFLKIWESTDVTCQLFELTAVSLYLLACLFLVIEYGMNLYFETKKEIVVSQSKLLTISIYKDEINNQKLKK